jgi:hypothetical protein
MKHSSNQTFIFLTFLFFFYLSNSQDPNCLSAYQNGTCIQCQPGYGIYIGGQCVNQASNCKTFAPDGDSCTSCYPGDCLFNDTCAAVSTQCNTFNPDTC